MGLKKFTEYSIRVVAFNKHGPGVPQETSPSPPCLMFPVPLLKTSLWKFTTQRALWCGAARTTKAPDILARYLGIKIRYRKGRGRARRQKSNGRPQLFQLIDGKASPI
ncbi:neogenin-like [Salvelinus sp. IW2-2015]|uniref:neogenin-like n=1 Tax=Salvelinus sp. IW2-2015 TaxID=2691554 RepID=UPI0038D39143